MIYRMYSIFDSKARKYNAPFLAANDEVATRNFNGLLSNDKMMADFKSDFNLYQVGTFGDDTGECEKIVPVLVASGNDFVVKSE